MVQQFLTRTDPIRVSRKKRQQAVLQSSQMNCLSIFAHTPLFTVQFYMIGYGGIHFYNCFAFRAKSNNALGKWQ